MKQKPTSRAVRHRNNIDPLGADPHSVLVLAVEFYTQRHRIRRSRPVFHNLRNLIVFATLALRRRRAAVLIGGLALGDAGG